MLEMLWPGARTRALTFSYDDGVTQDARLIKIMRKCGLKGTFNLNSGMLGGDKHIDPKDVKEQYAGFEVAVHSVSHPNLCAISDAEALAEVLDDRRALEEMVGYPVRGMAYPGGYVNEHLIGLLRNCGIVFSRDVKTTQDFSMPDNWLKWACSCHHKDLEPLIERFLGEGDDVRILSVWGHSYEFDRVARGWETIEAQMARLGGHGEVWYATNIEMFDYIDAYRNLDFSVNGRIIQNRSAREVFLKSEDGHAFSIKPGEVARMGE